MAASNSLLLVTFFSLKFDSDVVHNVSRAFPPLLPCVMKCTSCSPFSSIWIIFRSFLSSSVLANVWIGDDGAAAIAQGISSPECNLNTLKLASMSDYLFFLVSTSPLLFDWDFFCSFRVPHCAMEVFADVAASMPHSSFCYGVVFSPPPYDLFDRLSDQGCRCPRARYRTPIAML